MEEEGGGRLVTSSMNLILGLILDSHVYLLSDKYQNVHLGF